MGEDSVLCLVTVLSIFGLLGFTVAFINALKRGEK